MRVIGIDPGVTGAIAFLTISNGFPVELEIIDMPISRNRARKLVDEYAFAREIDARLKPDPATGAAPEPFAGAMIEQAGVRPGNGKVGSASFWLGIGMLRGVLAAHFIPTDHIVPQSWRRALKVVGDKDASRMRATAIFPRWAGLWVRAKDHGRAESALIALHGANQLPVLEARKRA